MPEVLPDFGAFIAAAFLALIACALWVLARVIGNTFGHLPLIGGWCSRNLVGWLNVGRVYCLDSAKASWGAGVAMINWASNYLWNTFVSAVETFESIAATVDHFAHVTVPDAVKGAEAWALAQISHAVYVADIALRTEISAVSRAVTAVRADALDWYHDATAYTDKTVAAAEKILAADITAAEKVAVTGLAATEHALTSAISSVASAATSDIASLATSVNGSIGQLARDIVASEQALAASSAAALAAVQSGIYIDLETWGDEAVDDVWPTAEQDIASLGNTIGADFPWLKDLLPALAGAGATGLLGALVRALAGAEAITNLADDCIIPNCRNLSQFGNDLANLLGDVSLAAFLAWLAFGVADPGGWAADMNDAALPLGQGLVNLGASVLGRS